MCVPATCPSCRKVTWSGCGMHVDQVMAGVPGDQRCTCASSSAPAEAPRRRGFFRR